jgi:hypothetical protein
MQVFGLEKSKIKKEPKSVNPDFSLGAAHTTRFHCGQFAHAQQR